MRQFWSHHPGFLSRWVYNVLRTSDDLTRYVLQGTQRCFSVYSTERGPCLWSSGSSLMALALCCSTTTYLKRHAPQNVGITSLVSQFCCIFVWLGPMSQTLKGLTHMPHNFPGRPTGTLGLWTNTRYFLFSLLGVSVIIWRVNFLVTGFVVLGELATFLHLPRCRICDLCNKQREHLLIVFNFCVQWSLYGLIERYVKC